jgi:hypothetical protein
MTTPTLDWAEPDRTLMSSSYTVRYFRGTTEITTGVLAGEYQTASLAPGGKFLIPPGSRSIRLPRWARA